MSYISKIREKVGHDTVIMPCAVVLIVNDLGEILLQKRVDDGTWGYHGGSIEIDESVEDCLIREVKEELGITIINPKLFKIYSGGKFHHVYPNGDHVSPIDILFICNKYEGEIKLQNSEVSEIRWFKETNLPKEISINHLIPILDYFKSLK